MAFRRIPAETQLLERGMGLFIHFMPFLEYNQPCIA